MAEKIFAHPDFWILVGAIIALVIIAAIHEHIAGRDF
jgi:hypothetical protein